MPPPKTFLILGVAGLGLALAMFTREEEQEEDVVSHRSHRGRAVA
jgi:hypothetical protein